MGLKMLCTLSCHVQFSIPSQVMLYIQDSRIASSQVFHDLSLPIWPSAIISIHFFTHLSLSILSTCPNHLNLPLCMQFLYLPTPDDLSTCQNTLPISATYIHHAIMSFLSNFANSSSFTAQVSLFNSIFSFLIK